MFDDITELVQLNTLIRLDRQLAGSHLTQEMLSRSREQLAVSEALLQAGMPKVWYATAEKGPVRI